jgi:transposase
MMMDDRETLEFLGGAYRSQRAVLVTARDILAEAVCDAVDRGMSESEAARVAGVSRMTVRSWLGKE